jgi:transcriptional regulator with XRE-family HTH domain
MQDTRARVSAALRSRLAPRGAIAVKEVAEGIGRSGEAVRQWLNGEAAIKAEDLAAIARYLRDPLLVGEVFGDVAQVVRERRIWFTDRGCCHDAAAGHADFARRYLGLPAHTADDLAVYAIRNLGWLEVTTAGAGARLRYHAKGLKLESAKAARAWLLNHAATIANVTRSVMVGEEWLTASGLSADDVAAGLALVQSATPYMGERCGLDLLPPRLGAILAAWRSSPHDALNAAGAAGLAGRASIFSIDGDDVVCRWLGSSIKISRDCVGKNLLGWSDPAYGGELRCAVADAKRDESTYTRCAGPVWGVGRRFDRLALKVADSVITITELLCDPVREQELYIDIRCQR